jgi:hypothetical protein
MGLRLKPCGLPSELLSVSNMSEPIRGRFYFKRTSNRNLLGEFSNHQSALIYTESADATVQSDDFVGSYRSTWQEAGTPLFADLVISRCPRNQNLFEVVWSRARTVIFTGEGMLCDEVLIGDYHSGS